MGYLYYSDAELATLKGLTESGTHATIYNAIVSWCSVNMNYIPQWGRSPDVDSYREHLQVRQHIENMCFMYHMTDDTDYADSALTAMMTLVDDWEDWQTWGTAWWQMVSWNAMSVCIGYDALKDYGSFTQAMKDRLIAKTELELDGPVYDRYAPVGATYFPSQYPNHESRVGGCIGICAMALGEASDRSADWLAFAVDCMEVALGYGGADGGWHEGPSYFTVSMSAIIRFVDIYKRIEEIDWYTTYQSFLENANEYFIYMNFGGGKLQMEDTTGGQGWDDKISPCYLYRLADQWSNTYANRMADSYAWDSEALSYIWKSSSLGLGTISDLPVYKFFDTGGGESGEDDIGYAIWKAGWDSHDQISVFKCGGSIGHAHNDQNSFSIWNNQYHLSGGPGYATGREEWDQTFAHNCILVDPAEYYGEGHGYWTHGQAQEFGDLASVAEPTKGDFQEHASTAFYSYARGVVSSSLYTNNAVPYLPTGDLDSWTRHFVLIREPFYFVIFDQVSDASSHEYHWCFNGNSGTSDQSMSMNEGNDLLTYTLRGDIIEIAIIEPATYSYFIELHAPNYGQDFYRAHIYPASATTADFLMVIFANNDPTFADVTITHVDQNNCKGVILTYSDEFHTYKDIVVFSDDGNNVSETIGLSLACEAKTGFPANGYSFDGNDILTGNFNPWLIVRAQDSAGEPPAPPAYKPKHIIM